MKDDLFNYLIATDSLDEFLGKEVKLSKKEFLLLNKYNINYNATNIKDLLININNRMTDYLNDSENYKILENLYNQIYRHLK